MGGIDAAMRLWNGESIGKAVGGAASTTIGATLGGILGQTLIPIPGVGAAVGAAAGGIIGDKLFNVLTPETQKQQQAADIQMAASLKQMQASDARLGNMGVDTPAGSQGIADPMKLGATIKMLGLEGNNLVTTYADNVYKARGLADQTQAARDALFSKVEELKKLGYDPKTIWGQTDIKALQTDYTNLQKATGAAAKSVDTAFKAMPQHVSRAIMTNMQKMSMAGPEAILAAKFSAIKIPEIRFQYPTGADHGPGGGGFFTNPPKNPPKPGEWALGSPFGSAKGSLGDAVASEMRMKPPGSDLVIANSSETVIPAAGGYGMLDFVETLRSGFNAMIATYKETQTKQENTLKSINATLVTNQQQTNARLQKLETKFSTPGMPGGLGGGAAGGVDAFTPIAQRMGLTMTSGYRPGDPGWHGANRARDFSNGTGPTPQMMQFAQYLASTYGSNLKELIYTPLGFSIKNGQQVAPYAQGAHYNHVHVAYALGAGNPAFFGSQSAAERWERSMVPGSVRVGSVTGNSAEGFGSGANIVNNITINQQPGQDADELASIVAMKIGEAVADARASSLFV
jgi:hypothetical protein